MTLDECFEKYSDDQLIERQSRIDENKGLGWSVGWWKGLKYWGDPIHIPKGFFLPKSMVEAAKADDWVLLNETI